MDAESTHSLSLARLGAEALGAAFLLATVIGSGIMGDELSGGNVAIALLANSLATGGILVVLIWMFGPISGAHFNPVVTLSFLLQKKISAGESLAFIIVQIIGGIAGVVMAHAMFGQDLFQASTTVRDSSHLIFAEVVATFGLVLVIMGCVRFREEAVGVAVGLYIMAAYWFTASTSFANPAVTIARTFSDTFAGIQFASIPWFIVAQIVGSVLATLVAVTLFKED